MFTCSKDNYTTLYNTHCFNNTCDDYFNEHTTRVVDGIPGLSSGVFHGELLYLECTLVHAGCSSWQFDADIGFDFYCAYELRPNRSHFKFWFLNLNFFLDLEKKNRIKASKWEIIERYRNVLRKKKIIVISLTIVYIDVALVWNGLFQIYCFVLCS